MTSPKIPLSLYIHVPWCERKCPYCDFNSHLAKQAINEPAYIQALLDDVDRDLERFGKSIQERPIQTVFIGGGTPSLFSPQSYQTLFAGLRERLEFSADAEITLEANPGSSEAAKFAGFRAAGINRLSIGVQSFNSKHLSSLGRVHDSQEALAAAKYAREAGFDNFNLDLMFGLPEQTTEQAVEDLQQALALFPAHLSCYQLTIEPNTLFHHNPPVTPDDDKLWEMQTALQAQIASAGFDQYEVSAYSLKGKECRHNLNYWHFGDYLGIGAGAHGKLTIDGNVIRTWKIKHPSTFMSKSEKTGGQNALDAASLAFEYMLNALRLKSGFELSEFAQRSFQTVESIDALLSKHEALGLITVNQEKVTPTEFGFNMLNSMLEDYLAMTEH